MGILNYPFIFVGYELVPGQGLDEEHPVSRPRFSRLVEASTLESVVFKFQETQVIRSSA